MKDQNFMGAYILLFSGAAQLKENQVRWEDVNGREFFIEFPDLTPEYAIARSYHDNGNICYEIPYKNGKINGIVYNFYKDGNKYLEAEYKNGKENGNYFIFDDDGEIRFSAIYKNGTRIK